MFMAHLETGLVRTMNFIPVVIHTLMKQKVQKELKIHIQTDKQKTRHFRSMFI
jgi:hypothetical protein